MLHFKIKKKKKRFLDQKTSLLEKVSNGEVPFRAKAGNMRSARGALRGIGTPGLESWAEGLREAGGDPKAHGPGNHRAPGHRSPGRSVSPARSGTRGKPLPGRASAPRGPASGPAAQAAAAPAPPHR